MNTQVAWTIMVYMAGDNNLSAAGDRDLVEMRRVGSTDDVNVIVEFDNAGNHGTRRIHVKKNGVAETVEHLGETDSGSPEVLVNFIKWAAENYPARRYALVLWNHGGGWAPTEVDRIARSVNSRAYNEREIAERSSSALGRAFFRSTLQKVFELESPSERAICSDDGSGHSLDTLELHRVIAQGVGMIGQPFDLLGMDACLMSNLEVAYQLREHVRYIVASEELEPANGWPYERILARFVGDPGMATADIAAHIVQDYVDSYVELEYVGDVTQTAVDLSRLMELTAPLDVLAKYLIPNMKDAYPAIWKAQRTSTRFFHNTLWDIGHFCEELVQHSDDENVRAAAAAVVEAHAVGQGRALIAEAHNGVKVQHCRGTSAYLIPPFMNISSYYEELAFARNFRWLDMLRAYHDAI